MNKGPRTTIVIPAYNAERFLERTLQSALLQTYENLEIILVDDGSTDRTRAIAEAFASRDTRLRIVSIPNSGVARARNVGIEQASGEFVAFLDADDLWHPKKIELQIEALTSAKYSGDAAAVYTRHRVIDEDDRVIRSSSQPVFSGYSFARHLYFKPVANGSTILVRREAAIEVGGFDSTFAARGIGGCEDLDFELKIAAAHPLTAIPQYLVGYRTYPGNMSSRKLSMARGMFATIKRHSHPELPPFVTRKATASACEYALSKCVAGRHWTAAAVLFGSLLRADPRRGLSYGAHTSKRIIGRKLRLVKEPLPDHVPDLVIGPLFYDLSPDADNGHYGASSEDQNLMAKLESVDLVWSEQRLRKYARP
jgi:Glycosyl transferase family 2